jgi:isocitrate/isopropylmalate dehydrogenase
LEEAEAANLLYQAIKENLSVRKIRTMDLGGHSRTNEVGDDVVRILRSS